MKKEDIGKEFKSNRDERIAISKTMTTKYQSDKTKYNRKKEPGIDEVSDN